MKKNKADVLVKKSSVDLATEEIRKLIITGKLRPNQRIIETEVAKILNMSRTPIRTALFKLESFGYVTKLANGAVIVTDQSPSQIRDLYEVREALQAMVARLACERASGEQIARIGKYLKKSVDAIKKRDLDRTLSLVSAFHNELIVTTKNEHLANLLEISQNRYLERQAMRLFTYKDWNKYIRCHERLLEGVRRRNPRIAEKAIHDDISVFKKFAMEYL